MTRRGRPVGPAVVLEFAEIAEQAPHARGILRGLGVRVVDIDDVLQDVLVGAWKSVQAGRFAPRPGMKLDAAIRIWLYGVCFNYASHYHHRAHRRREVLVADPWAATTEPSTDTDARLAASEIFVALWSLPLWARDLLLLAAVGHGETEIAGIMRIPVETAAGRLRRARRMLFRALSRR